MLRRLLVPYSMKYGVSRSQSIGCVVSGGSRVSVFLEKADRVVSTPQEAHFLLLVLGQTTFMFLHEMGSYPLGAGPPGTTERTLALPLMSVSSMPFQVLGSSIHFAAIGTVMHPPSLAMILRVPCASRVRVLSSLLKF